jgi:hypothetical protein
MIFLYLVHNESRILRRHFPEFCLKVAHSGKESYSDFQFNRTILYFVTRAVPILLITCLYNVCSFGTFPNWSVLIQPFC